MTGPARLRISAGPGRYAPRFFRARPDLQPWSRGLYELINDTGKANQKYAAENRKLKSRNQKLERELEITRNKLKLKEAQTEHVKIVTSKPNLALSTKKPSEKKYVT